MNQRSPFGFVAASVVAAIVGIAGLVACGGPPPPPPAPPPKAVDVLAVQPQPVRDSGEYLGSLLSRGSVNVLPQVGGYVKAIHVRPGQKVKAGDSLVDIDAREEAAALDSAVAQSRSSQSRVDLAKQTLQRTEALYAEGLAAAQELERVRADVQAAEAAAQASTAAVAQRQVQVQFHTVRAAVPGTVAEVPVRLGDAVTPSTLLLSIAQADVLELSVALPAARARNLTPNAPIEILDDKGAVLVATQVFYAAPQADPATQLVVVKAVFPNSVGLRPAEVVRARVVFGSSEALQVPALSVVRQSGQAFAFVVGDKDGKTVVTRRLIKLGPMNGQSIVITEGLVAGDRVAVSGLQALRDGTPVVPKDVTTAAPTTPATTPTTPATTPTTPAATSPAAPAPPTPAAPTPAR